MATPPSTACGPPPARRARPSLALGLVLAGLLAGCAERPHASLPLRHGFDPRATTERCLGQAHVATVPVGRRQLLLGSRPDGPSIVFTTTTAEAEAIELRGEAEGAERVGSALVFVHGASESVLTKAERCLKREDSLTLSSNS